MISGVQVEVNGKNVNSRISLSDFSDGGYIIQQIALMNSNSNEVLARTVCGIIDKTVLTSFVCDIDFSKNLYVMKTELYNCEEQLIDSREDFICL